MRLYEIRNFFSAYPYFVFRLFSKKLVIEMISGVSVGPESERGKTEPQDGRLKDDGADQRADTFKRWQTAYRLAETYALLNQSKPSFEAQFKVDQARELFLSLSEDYVTLGIRKDRFPSAPAVPPTVQQRLDEFGQTLDGHIKADPGDLPKERRKVLDTLLDAKQTDSVVGIKLPEHLYEECQNLGLSTKAAIHIIDQFKSFREDVAAQLSADRNHLKAMVSDLWDQLAEGASAETQHAQERADKRAKLLHLDEDLFGDGEAVEISSRASSPEAVYREQAGGSSWHTVGSSSGNSNAYFKASPAGSVSRLGSRRFDPSDAGPVAGGLPERSPKEQASSSKLWRKKLNRLEQDFNALEESPSTEQIKAWLNTVADTEAEAEPSHLKRPASEILDCQSEVGQDEPSLKRQRMGERDDRSSTASR